MVKTMVSTIYKPFRSNTKTHLSDSNTVSAEGEAFARSIGFFVLLRDPGVVPYAASMSSRNWLMCSSTPSRKGEGMPSPAAMRASPVGVSMLAVESELSGTADVPLFFGSGVERAGSVAAAATAAAVATGAAGNGFAPGSAGKD